jgi:hypothetical protein
MECWGCQVHQRLSKWLMTCQWNDMKESIWDWLTDWPTDCMHAWKNERRNDSTTESTNEWINGWLNELANERAWVSEWMNEWMCEWVNQWKDEWSNESTHLPKVPRPPRFKNVLKCKPISCYSLVYLSSASMLAPAETQTLLSWPQDSPYL